MSTNGIDLSQYQSKLTLKSFTGLDFVIAKATEGLTVKDPTYNMWALEAFDLGIGFGAYHFLHTPDQRGKEEADMFCAYARPRSGLSLWVDYETYGVSGEADAEVIELFISTVKLNVGKQQKVGLYANRTGLERLLPYRNSLDVSALWYADPSHPMTDQAAPLKWQIHQYETYQGVDRNYSIWSKEDWESYTKW